MFVRPVRFRRGRVRCDDDCHPCPDGWSHPIAVVAATVGLQLIGEALSRKLFGEQPPPPAPTVLLQLPQETEE